MAGIIMPVLKGAVVIGLFCFAGYGILYGLRKSGFTSAIQKSFRPKPTEKIYEDVKRIFGKGNFKDFSERISKYDLTKQKQYIDAYLNPQKKKLEGGQRKDGRERQSKKSI